MDNARCEECERLGWLAHAKRLRAKKTPEGFEGIERLIEIIISDLNAASYPHTCGLADVRQEK